MITTNMDNLFSIKPLATRPWLLSQLRAFLLDLWGGGSSAGVGETVSVQRRFGAVEPKSNAVQAIVGNQSCPPRFYNPFYHNSCLAMKNPQIITRIASAILTKSRYDSRNM